MQYEGVGGLIVLVADVWAIVNIFQSGGSTGDKVLWTVLVILLPILGGDLLLIAKVMYMLHQYRNKQATKDAAAFEAAMENAQQHDATHATLEARKQALDYQLTGTELGGKTVATDSKGLLKNISTHTTLPVVSQKKVG